MALKWTLAPLWTLQFSMEIVIYECSEKLHKFNSIYQAELAAINLATRWFINSELHVATNYTDSHSSVQALQNFLPGNSIIEDIYNGLINNSDKILSIGWIKAHVGLLGNERADELAKGALSSVEVDTLNNIGFSRSLVKKHYRKYLSVQ